MKVRGKKILAAALSLAMVLSLSVLPASAAEGDLTGAVGDKWTFVEVSDYSGQTSYKGLTFSQALNKNGDQHGMDMKAATITIPVTGQCNIEVEASYSWNLTLGDKTEVSAGNGSAATVLVFPYTGSAGSVELKANAQTYIKGIEIKEYVEPQEPTYAAIGDSWDFTTADSAKDKEGNAYTAQVSMIEADRFSNLTMNTVKYHGTRYGVTMGNGGSIGISVPGNCDIKVSVGYSWSLQLGEDASTKKTNPDNGDAEITFRYVGEAGTATLKAVGTSYIKSITLAETPAVLAPELKLDAESVLVKMGETAAVTATVDNGGGAAFSITAAASDGEATVAATVGNDGVITITPQNPGKTTLTVTATPTSGEAITADLAVRVLYPQTSKLSGEDKEYNFKASEDAFYAEGLEWSSSFDWAAGNGHGPKSANGGTLTVHLPEGKTATLTVTTCRYGGGTNVAMTANNGADLAVTTAAVDESGADGNKFTVKGASGDVVLTFTDSVNSKEVYVHALSVVYDVEKPTARKIDVWDFAAKAEAGEDYNNNITPAAWVAADVFGDYKGNLAIIKSVPAFGDLTLTIEPGDRLYSDVDDADFKAALGKNAGATYANAFTDGYTAAGAYYCNGTGGDNRRYATIARTFAGDKVVAYLGSSDGSQVEFNFQGSDQHDTAPRGGKGGTDPCVFVAEADGTYKLWATAAGKPLYYRVVRYPGVAVSGSITLPAGFSAADYGVEFINQTTGQKTAAEVDKTTKTFTATLAPGFTYTATLTGARGFGFTAATKKVITTDAESLTGKADVTLAVEEKQLYTYSGAVEGFADGYDLAGLVVTMVPSEEAAANGSEVVKLTLDKTAMTFTAELEPGVEYTIELTGVNDYQVNSPATVNSEADLTGQRITVELKAMNKASGKFVTLDDDDRFAPLYPDSAYAALTATVSKLEFENVDDGYTYPATISGDGYTAQLRDGAYLAKATVNGYATKTHVVVKGGEVKKDLLFVSTTQKPAVEWTADVYVGKAYEGKSNHYKTVNGALDAISRMGVDSEAKRVTVHIAPGVYREQIVLNTPYVTFMNDTPDKEVKLTWYYGIGYKYFSSNGFYDPELAFDKYEKAIADRWGTTVRVKGRGFRAEGITFENSLNYALTDEELSDGVESTKTTILLERDYALDVESKAATERAAAICVEANENEFFNCKFLSSQDTVYTNGTAYFKNCLIEGQTDYIFGDTASKCVFDTCRLNWKGYSEKSQAGYITAVRSNAGDVGYLFRSCAVTAGSKLIVAPGYFGRPWGEKAAVFFLNTQLEKTNVINGRGWMDWGGEGKAPLAKNAQYKEFGTKLADGTAVDVSGRVENTMATQAQADAVKIADYFGAWVPYYYKEEAATVAFAAGKTPAITDNGDINLPKIGHTLTVTYSLGENDANDNSLIQWYRVKDGVETLIHTSSATLGKSYKIAKEDVDAQIKVVVTPTTISGKTGEAGSATVAEKVINEYEDPSGSGDAELGDGVNIFLVGDSTVMDYSAAGMYTSGKARNEGSWGEFLQSYFNKDSVTVVDYAKGGASSRSLMEEQHVLDGDKIPSQIKEGDYLFIQFGHNDAYDKDGRYVPLGDPVGGVYPSTPGEKGADGKYTGGTYKWFLQQYIDVAKAAGATPVLVTPVARMYYNSDGTIRPHHDKDSLPKEEKTNSYCTAVKQLAQEQDVLFLDGFELTKTLYENAWKGDEANSGNKTYGEQIMYEKSPGQADGTHNNKLGGMIEAAIVARAIQDMKLPISKAVKAPAKVQGNTTGGKTQFVVDGEGKLTANSWLDDYAPAPFWTGYGQKLFDDIAAKAKELNPGSSDEPGKDPTPSTPSGGSSSNVPSSTGSKTETVTNPDGSKTTTKTDRKGNVTVTIQNPDGSKVESVTTKAGDKTITATDAKGKVQAKVELPAVIPTPENEFTDVPAGHWAEGAINAMAGMGMINGVSSEANIFDMTSPITRGSIATILFRLSNGTDGKKTTFVDVSGDAWYADAVGWASSAGVVTGYTENAFGPNDFIAREQMAVMLARYAKLLGMDTRADAAVLAEFGDAASTGLWAIDGMAWCVQKGIIQGKGGNILDPASSVSRAEAAVMLERMIELIK